MGSDVSLSKAVRANLLSLQNTASMMDKTQNRLATGNKVNSALDNPSSFFTASALNSRAADMSNLLDSMASGIKVIEAANNGITALTKNLESMQSTLRQARQDKSFQTKSFEVNDATKIKLGGGQFDVAADISLATATVAGTKAQVSTSLEDYLGPQSSNANTAGAGARSVIDVSNGFNVNDVFNVAGVAVTVTSTAPADIASDIQSALNNDTATAGKYTVSVGTGTDNLNKVIIETVDTSAAAASVEFDADADGVVDANEVNAAVKGQTTFNFSALTGSVTAGGEAISVGADFEDFVASLEAAAEDGGYTVQADATTKQITLTSAAWGGAAPTVTGVDNYSAAVPATKASTDFTLDTVGGAQTLTIAGEDFAVTNGMTDDALIALFEDSDLNDTYELTSDGSGNFTVEARAAGAGAAPTVTSNKTFVAAPTATTHTVTMAFDFSNGATDLSAYNGQTIDLGGGATYTFDGTDTVADLEAGLETGGAFTFTGANGSFTITKADGTDFTITMSGSFAADAGSPTVITATNGTPVNNHGLVGATTPTPGGAFQAEVKGLQTSATGANGASVETVAAEKAEFTVSYDGKTANVSIAGVKGGVGSAVNALDTKNWQDATIASVNTQLQQAGITGVEATFDDDGKFALVAKSAEAKTIAVSGNDSVALFGTNGVSTGVAEKSQLNATKTVDKFVELINRDHGGKVRASNDNGKLRIENLSTQELSVGVDLAGNDAAITTKIDGNTVRANLSKQFNELRDQLDKLSDDASFNGINLLRGDKLKITFNESGTSSIDIQAKDANGNVRGINASNLSVDSLVAEDLDTDEAIDGFLAKLSSALTELRSQASAFGSNLSSVENRQSFTKNMINTLETGAANLTLADTNEEAANLLALQTRQQLSSSALSMASQQDQAVLQLLR